MIREAVILAAGRGIRLKALGKLQPKGFIEIGGRYIVETSLERLARAGIEVVHIVTGHLAHFYEELASRRPEVRLHHNLRYAESGSMATLYEVRAALKGECLILESDLIYEQRALSLLLGAQTSDVLLVSGKTNSGDEVYAAADNNRLTGLSKVRAQLADEVIGELVGITRLSPEGLEAMCAYADHAFKETLHVDYEQALVAASSKVPVLCLKVHDLAWSEIDDENQLIRARDLVFPHICANDLLFV
jgi:2-aminoethylphosphonate-pyruvate transaminase